MTKVLKTVGKYQLNKGTLQAEGLYNVSTGEGQNTKVSFWFDEDTKNDMLSMTDEEFIHDAKALIEYAESVK